MIGYKATDVKGKCRGFQFEVGKTYTKNVKKENMKCCFNCKSWEINALNCKQQKSNLTPVYADYVCEG